jgi:hypothetical protein
MVCARWLLALFLAVGAWAKEPFFGGMAPRTREAVTQVPYFAYTVGYASAPARPSGASTSWRPRFPRSRPTP